LSAQTCSACHGDAGVPQDPQFPELADQSAAAIYKELRDYKSGARVSPFMTPIVQPLSDSQMIEAAAYFSTDHVFGALGPRWEMPDPQAAALVKSGDPARELPACDACHAPGVGGPIETPTLNGQSQVYLLGQLQAFASGARRNDEYGRMRAVARKLNADEQARLALYYQGLGPGVR
jgi:cytochrome c553